MAQSEPKKDQKLYPVYFGDIIGNNAGKEGVYTQKLYPTYFGEIIAGNDWITSTAPATLMMIMVI